MVKMSPQNRLAPMGGWGRGCQQSSKSTQPKLAAPEGSQTEALGLEKPQLSPFMNELLKQFTGDPAVPTRTSTGTD